MTLHKSCRSIGEDGRRTWTRISRIHDCTTGFVVGRRSFFRRYAENTSIGEPRTRTYITRHVVTHTHIYTHIHTHMYICALLIRLWAHICIYIYKRGWERQMCVYVQCHSTHVPCKPALIFHVCAITRDPFRGWALIELRCIMIITFDTARCRTHSVLINRHCRFSPGPF